MLMWIWKKIQLFLPFGIIIYMYKNNKSIPANIRTRSGRMLHAIMITTDYGILYSDEVYIKNRTKVLKQMQQSLLHKSQQVEREINNLSFEEKELLYHGDESDGDDNSI